MVLAEKTINSLLTPDKVRNAFCLPDHELKPEPPKQHHTKAPPNVVYAQLKYMWASGAHEESLHFLRQFSASLSKDLAAESSDHVQRPNVSKEKLTEISRLLARCYFKQGSWQAELKEDWGSVSLLFPFSPCPSENFVQRNTEDILHSYYLATHFDNTWYKAWHTWALANFDVISYMETQNETRSDDPPAAELAAHVVQAIEGSLSIRFTQKISFKLDGQVSSGLLPYVIRMLYKILSGF